MTYLLFLALAPAALLMRYVWKKDKSKEPFGMLLILVLLGALACLPAAIAESRLESVYMSVIGNNTSYLYHFVYAFFGVALAEEGFKFLFMFLYTRKHKEFNGLFDGMVYAVFVSLGFAALENIIYVAEGGVSVAIARGLMAVPGHMFFGVFMGYYYSLWHVNKLCYDSEEYFAKLGYIQIKTPRYHYKHYLMRAVLVPMFFHGLYDFCLFTGNPYLVFVNLALVVILYIVCFNRLKKMAHRDVEDYRLIPFLLCRKYPELVRVILPDMVNPLAVPQNYYTNPVQNKGVYYDPQINKK